ncbi:MAG TPA: Nramp family divalent metal transporter [Acidimicrobiales bacterium]|jgi:NRAMP (natural resistance-associated macrophage protein)-like metal ion transporter|nr:Nramp family divalent metal transporter [Acidimicrobiales bacterium]
MGNAQPSKPTAARPGRVRVDTTSSGSGPLWRQYLRIFGPGLVTGASDDDPSGIATYAQAGSRFRFGMVWAALLSLPLMSAVQEVCDRTALATGKGIGELVTDRFRSRWRLVIAVLLAALILANTLNIAADLVAIGEGAHLLHAGPTWLWALVAGVVLTALITSGSFHLIARAFKILCLALLAYVAVLFAVPVPWGQVTTHILLPHITLSKEYLALLAGVLGTTISPYLFFWQSVHRLEEMREEPEGGPDNAEPLGQRSRKESAAKIRASRLDVFTGMAFSNLVMFAIIVATSVTLGAHGQHDVASAAQAAAALRPIAGRFASTLFALGFIGSGALAIPVLAGAGSAGLAGLLGKESGFSRSLSEAPVFYGLVLLGTVGGMVLSFLGVDPVHLLVFVAIVNGIAAAPFLVVVMLISHDRSCMGEYVNGRLATVLGWAAVALMTAAAVGVFATL